MTKKQNLGKVPLTMLFGWSFRKDDRITALLWKYLNGHLLCEMGEQRAHGGPQFGSWPHPTDSPLASDVFLMWKSWFFVMVADLTLKKRKGN